MTIPGHTAQRNHDRSDETSRAAYRMPVTVAMYVSLALCDYPAAHLDWERKSSGRIPRNVYSGSADWPKGIVNLPRHPSKVYSSWVNGNEWFYFKATAQDANELLTLFSRRECEIMRS